MMRKQLPPPIDPVASALVEAVCIWVAHANPRRLRGLLLAILACLDD
jgi:hypothetical protein